MHQQAGLGCGEHIFPFWGMAPGFARYAVVVPVSVPTSDAVRCDAEPAHLPADGARTKTTSRAAFTSQKEIFKMEKRAAVN